MLEARNKTLLCVAILCLTACASKEKTVKSTLTEREYNGSLNYQHQAQTLTLDYFGDQLSGIMSVADSCDADSSTFESNGIKLKIKVTRNKKGGKDIAFKAEAKPVARSTLTSENTNINQTEKLAEREKTLDKNKVKTSPAGWGWLIGIAIVALLYWLIRRAIKI